MLKSPEQPFRWRWIDLVECKFRLKPDTRPIKQKGRPMNPKMEWELRSQIDIWLSEWVIEESQSPWSSPLVPVTKKDGTTQYAVDYRQVNSACIPDAYPLPPDLGYLRQMVAERSLLYYRCHKSLLDKTSTSRHQVDDRFFTPWGLYHRLLMP